jgi:nucleoside-diphosphate-sugar epimerase
VLGGDGFCGWPVSLHLSDIGHEVRPLPSQDQPPHPGPLAVCQFCTFAARRARGVRSDRLVWAVRLAARWLGCRAARELRPEFARHRRRRPEPVPEIEAGGRN